jgi:uncharacterized Zn-binding protein involved in type VI secretion
MSGFIDAGLTTLGQMVDSTIKSTDKSVDAAVETVSDPAKILADPIGAVRKVSAAIDAVKGLPDKLFNDLIETGVAMATNAIAAILPAFPAAQLGSLYVGAPHAHAHPPSLIPPAPPVPLPSMGAITLGTCIRVLVGGMPAARVGDLGMAPTCGGLAPFFTVFLGSSKVFIGGARAARMTDMCTVCSPGQPRPPTSALSLFLAAKDLADGLETAAETAQTDAAMAAAQVLAASMTAAQTVADAVAAAMTAMMGSDPAIPPKLPGFIMMGAPTVLIAGVPVPATAAMAKWLKNKLKGLASKAKGALSKLGKKLGGGCGCQKAAGKK